MRVHAMPWDPHNIDDATLRLIIAPGLGPATIRKLRSQFGSDSVVAGASAREIASIDGIGMSAAQSIRRAIEEADTAGERRTMADAGARVILRRDDDYPALLAAIPNAPEALFLRGQLADEDRLAVAIVGSRRCTSYGREQSGRFAALLAQSGLTIVSGGALGIDSEAHRGALRVNGRTIVILGCGLATCYPPQNEQLFHRIVEAGGALLTEHPMRVAPIGKNFPRRNRIISGLSLGVLVIEAALRSGALITARLAAEEHGREVMALPGRVDSPASAGCHRLLRSGSAALVVNHADVLEQLDASSHLVRGALASAGHEVSDSGPTLFDQNLTAGQEAIVNALTESQSPLAVDQIAARTQRPMSELMADITLLEIRGRLRRDQQGVRLRT